MIEEVDFSYFPCLKNKKIWSATQTKFKYLQGDFSWEFFKPFPSDLGDLC